MVNIEESEEEELVDDISELSVEVKKNLERRNTRIIRQPVFPMIKQRFRN